MHSFDGMTFEIYRCGTSFCWRLLDANGSPLCTGAKERRHRQQIEEDVLALMDKVPNANIVDKTSTNTQHEHVVPTTKSTNGHGKRTRAGA